MAILRKARIFGTIVCFTGPFAVLQAQQISISGIVSDAGGKGIAGAIVSLVAAKKSAITDVTGSYSISNGVTAVRMESSTLPPRQSPFLKGIIFCFSVLENASPVRVDMYTLLGTHVRTIFEKNMARGDYQISPFAKEVPSQLYFLKVRIGNNVTVLTLPLLAGANRSQALMKKSDGATQSRLSKQAAAVDSFLVGSVGYTTLSQTTDAYVGTKNFTLQKTVSAGSAQIIRTSPSGDFLSVKSTLTSL